MQLQLVLCCGIHYVLLLHVEISSGNEGLRDAKFTDPCLKSRHSSLIGSKLRILATLI